MHRRLRSVTVEFECVERIAAPVETVFDLSLDIDAHVASMADSGERAIGGVTSGLIGLGETVTWRAKHFGVPFTLRMRDGKKLYVQMSGQFLSADRSAAGREATHVVHELLSGFAAKGFSI